MKGGKRVNHLQEEVKQKKTPNQLRKGVINLVVIHIQT